MKQPLPATWLERGATTRQIIRPTRGFYVYIAWGRDRERPLYVGQSRQLHDRIGTHLRDAPWRKSVLRFEVYAFTTAADALEAESDAIASLHPIHNLTGNGDVTARLVRTVPKPPRAPRAKKVAQPYQPEPSGYPDYFTPEQFEIIRRVQKAGRP